MICSKNRGDFLSDHDPIPAFPRPHALAESDAFPEIRLCAGETLPIMKTKQKSRLSSIASAAAWLGLAATSGATVLSNLNSPSQLTSDFNAGYSNNPWTHATSGGLGDSGCAEVPVGDDVLMTYTTGYSTEVGGSYTIGAYFYNVYNSGYGALGFSNLSSANPIFWGNPDNSIGVSIHGGGGEYVNIIGSSDSSSATWGNGDLATNAWFYAQTTLTFTAVDAYSLTTTIWNSDANGVLGSQRANDTVTGSLGDGYKLNESYGTIYAHVGTSGSRFTKVDNISTAGSTGAIPEPSAVVLLGATALGLGLRRRRA